MDLFATFPANASENHAFADNLELLVNSIRDWQIIIGPAIKIEYFTTTGAMDMMMVCHIRIKSLGASKNFNNLYEADFCKGQQGAVHGIERNIRIFFFYDLVDGVSGGMGI